MSVTDYPLFSAPTISLAKFTSVLQTAHSPMAGEAAGVYQAFVAQGVNPAIGLAIASHESSFGKLGIAVGRNNPYGDRYYASAAAFGGQNVGGWVRFPSYTAAASYEAHLLATSYRGFTARTFAQKYAPSSDGNNPSSYGATIVRLVSSWSGGKGAIATSPTPRAPSKASTKPAAPRPPATSGALSKPSLTLSLIHI